MTGLVVQGAGNLPTQFKPEQTFTKQAQLDAIIDLAKRTLDLDALESAVDLKIAEQTEFIEWWVNNVGRPGGNRQTIIADPAIMLTAEKAGEITGFSPDKVSRIKSKLKDVGKYRDQIVDGIKKKIDPDAIRGTEGTGENEWYTPAKYIEAAHQVLGQIDTDPASSEYANETVQAAQYFTEKDDGLSKEWSGNVWMNPPYAQPLIQQFIEKLASEYSSGNVTSAIALTHNYTDTVWFHIAEAHCAAICFTRGRIRFESPDGSVASPTQGQAFFYFGKDVESFESVFSEFGFVLVNVTV